MRAPLHCPACERPGAVRAALGYIEDDGTVGQVAGIACAACGYLREDRGAPYVPTGRVDLGGKPALDWLLAGLRAAGCDPVPCR